MRFLWVAVALLAGCATTTGSKGSVARRAVQLIAEAPEKETTQRTDKREDIEIDTRDHERTPRVVAKGESPVLTADGAAIRLYGDAEGTQGFSVDNFVLLEVLSTDGKILDRIAIGFTEGVIIGAERVDLLGRQAFSFEPGEVVLTSKVPEKGPFKVRATVLDNYGVGRTSNIFMVIDGNTGTEKDDLRGQYHRLPG